MSRVADNARGDWRADARRHPVAAVVSATMFGLWLATWLEPVRTFLGTMPTTTIVLFAPIAGLASVWVIRGWSVLAVTTWGIPLIGIVVIGYAAPEPVSNLVLFIVAAAIVGLAMSSRVIDAWAAVAWRLVTGAEARQFDRQAADIANAAHGLVFRRLTESGRLVDEDENVEGIRRRAQALSPPCPVWAVVQTALIEYLDSIGAIAASPGTVAFDAYDDVGTRWASYVEARASARMSRLRQHRDHL